MKVTGLKRRVALLLIAALFSGVLPMKEGVGSRAAEQPALRNPRILKGTQEVAPGLGGQKELKNPTTEEGITTWDSIWFGNYWQGDTNGDGKADKNDEKQPIKWRVLSVDGDDVFLLADKNIDVQRYNDTDTETDVTWETCTMRSWLNGYGAEANSRGKDYRDNNFLNNAFTEGEQSAIKTTKVINNDNSEHGTEGGGGSDTLDKVYLLSMDEVMNPAYGFTSDTFETATRNAVNTAYVAEGGETDSSDRDSAGSSDDWWLRSSGAYGSLAAHVISYGAVNRFGYNVYSNYVGVRPALHLNLKSSLDAISTSSWLYAGTVTSGGGEKEEASPQPTEPGSTQKSETSAVPQTTANPVQTGELTAKPSEKPDIDPTTEPSSKPEEKPDGGTTAKPSEKPDINPTTEPSSKPDVKPDEGSTAEPEEPEEPTEKPYYRMGIKVDRYSYKTSSSVNGAALPVTKGCLEEVTLLGYNLKREKNPVNWTVGNTNIAEITTIKTNKKGKSSIAVIKGKKYGKTTLTAEYGRQKTTITIKVVKNEYSAKPRKTSTTWGDYGKEGITAMRFDKEGNLIFQYYFKKKLKKNCNPLAKRPRYKIGSKGYRGYYLHYASPSCGKRGCSVIVKDIAGKVVVKTRVKILYMMDTKNEVYIKKYKIKKKQIKGKQNDIDLRRCKIYVDWVEGGI